MNIMCRGCLYLPTEATCSLLCEIWIRTVHRYVDSSGVIRLIMINKSTFKFEWAQSRLSRVLMGKAEAAFHTDLLEQRS